MGIDFSSVPSRVGAVVTALGLILAISNSSADVLISQIQSASEETGAVEYPVENHLIPVNFRIDADIRAKVEAKLFTTGSEYGRMLIIPAEVDGESSISIHRERTECIVTYIKADRNLWNMFADENSGSEPRVQRLDVPVSLATAEAIRNCWAGMLAQMRPSSATGLPPPTHLKHIEFSLNRGTAVGETPIRFGDKVNDLVGIGTSLIAYCQAQPNGRSEMEKQIQIRSQSLLSKLQRK